MQDRGSESRRRVRGGLRGGGESEGLHPSVGLGNPTALKARLYLETTVPALAAVHGMHFLLTWNCAHIANAERVLAIEACCRDHGLDAPVICTPEELMGD